MKQSLRGLSPHILMEPLSAICLGTVFYGEWIVLQVVKELHFRWDYSVGELVAGLFLADWEHFLFP
jgi:hypothetical protein